MMNSVTMAALVAATVGVSACAAADADVAASARPGSRDCFHANSVNGFNPVDDDTVDVTVGASRKYRLELAGICPDVDWSWRIALRTRGGSSRICDGFDAELIVPGPTGRQRCLVSSVRRLTAAEVEATRRRN